jgi:hypothetical protein
MDTAIVQHVDFNKDFSTEVENIDFVTVIKHRLDIDCGKDLTRYRNYTDTGIQTTLTFYTDLDKDMATTLTGPQQRLDLRILLYTVVILCTT